MGAVYCFIPAILMSSTYTDKNNLCFLWTKRHSQFGTFSHPSFNETSSNCRSHNSPAKGWPYRFRSRGTTGSSILDHDFGHLCRGRRIQMSGHSDFGIFNNLGAPSIFTWVLADTVLRNQAVWRWYPWLLLLSFVMLMILVPWILRKTLNRLLQYHFGVPLDLCIFGALSPIRHFQMTYVHQWGEMNFYAFCPCFIDHLFLTSDFRQVPRPNLFQFLLFFIHCCFCCGNFHGLRHRNKFVNEIIMLHGVDTLQSCCVDLLANSQYRSTHFFAWPSTS